MRKLYMLASHAFGGGAAVALALGCLLAGQQPAEAATGVVYCAIPPSCPTVSCDLTWFGDQSGTCTATVGGPDGRTITACNCV